MNERIVNIFAAITSVLLVILYIADIVAGDSIPIRFVLVPLVVIIATYTMLAYHQFTVAMSDGDGIFLKPVPFRWVVWFKYVGFSVLGWFIILGILLSIPFELEVRQFLFLVSALIHVWFLRRFVVWTQPVENRHDRDLRQEATDVRQDARDVIQDDREIRIYEADRG